VDIVTQADITSNELISKAIKKNYPSHGIISEEGEGYQTDSDYVWYIDPLDGTKNFASHTPLFGINIALVFKGDVTHAAVYLPYLKDYIYAEKGKGAFLNGKKAFCSQKEDWQGAYGLGTMMFKSEYKIFQEGIFDLSNGTCWTNAVASSAVAGLWVSSGKRD
jgi:myo-inositol-1(or 4)-monophosphatase